MNNNSNHSTVWILGLIVVLVLGVLIGANLQTPALNKVTDEQQANNPLKETKSNLNSVIKYKLESNEKSEISFSYPSDWSIGNDERDKYGTVGMYTIIPKELTQKDAIYINTIDYCGDIMDPTSNNDFWYSKMYIFYSDTKPIIGRFLSGEQIANTANLLKSDDFYSTKLHNCRAMYTKSTNKNVLNDFDKIAKSIRSNIH